MLHYPSLSSWYRSVSLIFLLLIGIMAYSQTAEPIYPLSQRLLSADYYQQQAKLWEASLNKDASEPIHWLHYYMAARYANMLGQQEQAYDLARIAQQVADSHPQSFEHHYITFASSRELSQDERWDLMFQAHEVAPHRTEVWAALILYYELQGKPAQKQQYLQDWLAARQVSTGLLEWNYNALASVGKAGVLLTQGDNDTYPAWALQEVHGIRQDVQVLNLPLLINYPAYRHRLFREIGATDTLGLDPTLPYADQVRMLIEYLQTHLGERLYLGIGIDNRLRELWSGSLYLTGLAFQYSKQAIANLSLLRKNWENKFRKDALYRPLDYGPDRAAGDHMNLNYLPGLILLERDYRREQLVAQANELFGLAEQIAQRAGRKDMLQSVQNRTTVPPDFISHLSFKDIENQMKPIDGNLFAAATETTNGTYTAFLLDLLALRDTDRFNRFQAPAINWSSYLPKGLSALSGDLLYTSYHPDDTEAPIVNISHEAATAFCQWLTQLYNQWDKRKYQEVLFRLPTKEEWIQAARGGHSLSPYPWGGYYYQNARGCYLLNTNPFLNPEDENADQVIPSGCQDSPSHDGALFTTRVDAYHPNDFGLYNMSGNAAEMVQDHTYTMGGSWNESIKYAAIGVTHQQDIPSPMVGFRVFMEVVLE